MNRTKHKKSQTPEPSHKEFARDFVKLCKKFGLHGASAEWQWDSSYDNGANVAYFGPCQPAVVRVKKEILTTIEES